MATEQINTLNFRSVGLGSNPTHQVVSFDEKLCSTGDKRGLVVKILLGVTLQWSSIPCRREQWYSQVLYATETGILDPFLESHCNFSGPEFNTVWHEIFAGVYFCGLAIFFFLRLGQIGFSGWELILRFSESTQYPALTIFLFLLSTYNRNAYYQTILRCASIFHCIPLCF